MDCASLTRSSKRRSPSTVQRFLCSLLPYEEEDIERGLRKYIEGKYYTSPLNKGEVYAVTCVRNSYKNRNKKALERKDEWDNL